MSETRKKKTAGRDKATNRAGSHQAKQPGRKPIDWAAHYKSVSARFRKTLAYLATR